MSWILFVVSGIVTPIGCLIWLRRHGDLSRRALWCLLGFGGLWGFAGICLAFGWQTIFSAVIGVAFAGLTLILVRIYWRWSHQQAEIERLRRLVEAHSDRISALSHEIRTPLALIKGASDLLLEGKPGPLTSQQLTFLQTISQNGEHLISLAEDILIQARIEAGIFNMRLELVDLPALIKKSVGNMRGLEAHRQQKFWVDCPQVIERTYADPRLLTQVMSNLIRNACRHTSQGGNIYVQVSENDTNDTIIVSVTDDGAGMTPEEREHLFERFSSSRTLGDGTGLGLLISRQIIELHSGHILVDTTMGRGTTILFAIPRWRNICHDEQTAHPGSR